jgi:hypothetical protein
MRTASAVATMLLAGCAAKQPQPQTPKLNKPVVIGKTDEADAIALLGQPIKTVIAPNGAKNETFALSGIGRTRSPGQSLDVITYVFGTDGILRHIIMEAGASGRFLMQEKDIGSVLPGEIVGPPPTVTEITIRRAS